MGLKKADVAKPVLPSEKIVIPSISDEPATFWCVLQYDITELYTKEKEKYPKADWTIFVAHLAVCDDDGERILDIADWITWQSCNRAEYDEIVLPALLRLNGYNRDVNKKKSRNQKQD